MSSRWQALVKKHHSHIFEIQRRGKLCSIDGFMLAASNSLILLQEVFNSSKLDGYTVIRDADVKAYRVFDKPKYWTFRAARKFRLKPTMPSRISIDSLPELLESINARYPLLTIHPEKKKPNVCYIGPLLSTAEKTFTIDDLDSDCEWTGPRKMRWEDVTRVSFGGQYEKALAATAPKRRKKKL